MNMGVYECGVGAIGFLYPLATHKGYDCKWKNYKIDKLLLDIPLTPTADTNGDFINYSCYPTFQTN